MADGRFHLLPELVTVQDSAKLDHTLEKMFSQLVTSGIFHPYPSLNLPN